MKLFLLKAAFSTTGLQLSALARRFPLCELSPNFGDGAAGQAAAVMG
jgi:hypothetical protein